MKKNAKPVMALLILCLSLTINAWPQTGAVILNGEVKNRAIDSIKVGYYPSYASQFLAPTRSVHTKIRNGKFTIKLDHVADLSYICIMGIKNGSGDFLNCGHQALPFFIEPGDNIQIRIDSSQIIFQGKGSGKYNCNTEINNIFQAASDAVPNGLKDYVATLDSEKKAFETGYRAALAILSKYKTGMSSKCLDLFQVNIRAFGPSGLIENLLQWVSVVNAEKYLAENSDFFNITAPADNIAAQSSVYARYLFVKEILLSRLHTDTIRSRSWYFPRIFNSIEHNYTGKLRDKLLYICSGREMDDSNYYLGRIRELIESGEYKQLLEDRLGKIAKGAKVFDFHLQDTKGKTVEFSSFRNKVVLLDIYFTGCSGCVTMAKAMKPVIEAFRNNPDVVFVSIDMDKDKDMFLKAVASGKYSDSNSINVYTNGQGGLHKFIRYYGFEGAPQLLLADKRGNILYANPPKPALDHQTLEPNPQDPNVLKLIQIINDGLKAPSI